MKQKIQIICKIHGIICSLFPRQRNTFVNKIEMNKKKNNFSQPFNARVLFFFFVCMSLLARGWNDMLQLHCQTEKRIRKSALYLTLSLPSLKTSASQKNERTRYTSKAYSKEQVQRVSNNGTNNKKNLRFR